MSWILLERAGVDFVVGFLATFAVYPIFGRRGALAFGWVVAAGLAFMQGWYS